MSESPTDMPETPGPVTAAVVSGGSRGLGIAMVRTLLDRGVRVATFSRGGSDELDALRDDHGEALFTARVDAADRDAVGRFVREAQAAIGPLDGLVANAAVGQDSLLVHTAEDAIAATVEVNLTATLLLVRQFLRRLLARSGRGRIVLVTSICARRGYPGLVAYSATKGGLEAAARSLAREMRGRVLVNSLAPGFFASEMSSVLGTDQLDAIVRRTPSGRLVEPEDVLPLVELLLLAETNLNGETITVDGGGAI